MSDSAERVEFQIAAPGADEASQAWARFATQLKVANDNLAGATRTANVASGAFDSATRNVNASNKAFASLSQNSQRMTQTIAALGGAVSRASPELGMLGQAVGRASGTIGAMTSMLGGPWGLAIGGATIAVGVLADKYAESKREADAFIKSQAELAEKTKEVAAALEQATLKQRDADALYLASLGKRQEVIAAEQRLQEAVERRERVRRDQPSRNLGGGVQIVNLANQKSDEDVAAAQKNLEDAKAKRGQYADHSLARAVASPKFSDGTTEAGRAEYASQIAAIQKAELDGAKRNQEMLAEQERAAFENKKALLAASVDAEAAANAEKFALARATAGKLESLDRATIARQQQIRETGMEAFSSVATIGIQSLSKLAQGQKISAKQFIGVIGDQLVALGTKNLLEGIAMTAASLGFPTGAPLIVAGTAEIAAGIGMGAASRGASAGGGGGSSGGGQRFWNPGGGWSKGSAISPTAMTDDSKVSPNTPIIINMSTVTSPSPEDAKRVQRAMDQAARNGER